jgi:4-amino-4-deoxy-L-arabinose transferase-like glycosyltransferase
MDQTTGRQDAAELSPWWRRALVAGSMLALVWVVLARGLGPSDAWHQSQPPTIAYTTDIIVNGNWILPQARARDAATKPPLYNWLAVPMVRLMGLASDPAHKAPSLAALCLCWLIMVRLGRRLDPTGGGVGGALGWLAALCLVANYSVFKLGYLARPDMLLALWLLLGWCACTALLLDAARPPAETTMSRRTRLLVAFGFWLCLGLAGLTKGPAALPLLVYAVVAARLVGGRWPALGTLCPWWGLPLSLAVFGAWAVAAWRIDPEHVLGDLWGVEFVGRLTGLGPEGSREGPIAVLTTAPYMVLYYLGFFFPWSVLSVLAMVRLWSRPAPGAVRRWRELGARGAMLHGAAIFVIVTVALYSLSASKRADYAVVAFAPGALLAAWWLLEVPPRLAIRAPWAAPIAAALVLGAHTVFNQLQPEAPQRDFGDAISRFSRDAERHLRAAPAPVVFWASQFTLPESYFGSEGHTGPKSVREMIGTRSSFWIFAGRRTEPPITLLDWLPKARPRWTITEACRSPRLPRADVWPEQVVLYRVDPPRR